MAPKAQQIAEMVDMLPEGEQSLAYEFIKRLVLAWDPDYTKATPQERVKMDKAMAEYGNGEFIQAADIDWNAE